ncbi:MAG: phosphatase PAP2 family protein [Candidatus Rokubacteria bacterium]|nr:phosphatase PAP2 family protein [Candidatus Rokubacteria bacterium]
MTRVALLHPRSVLLVTLACFAALSAAAALAGVLPADAALRDQLLALASPPMIAAMRVINAAGDYRLLIPGTALLFVLFPRARRRWWLWVGLMVVAAAGPDAVKLLIARPRPFDTSLGFPSGHATAAAAYFGAVMYLAGSLRPPPRVLIRLGALVMIVLVAVARVMLRAHWPSDALGGVTLGLALASAAALIAALPPADA